MKTFALSIALAAFACEAAAQPGPGTSNTNPAIGTNGTTGPGSSTQIGAVDLSGNLQPASATNPLPMQGVAGGTPVPTSVADGANVTTGSKADAADCTTTHSLIACLRQADADIKAGGGSTGSAAPSTGVYVAGISSGNLTGIVQADGSVAISVSTATTTQLVALASSKKIYVTAFDIVVAAADNITLEYGTGSSCGTGTTTLTGAWNFAANGGISKGGGLGPVYVVPASNALCMVTSAAVQASGSVSYTQF